VPMSQLDSHPVLTCAEAKAWEAGLLKDEASEWAAMQRAGAALAMAVEEDFREIGGLPDDARILVLAGKGHNGGDALLAAKGLLAARPAASVETVFAFDAWELRPLARRAWQALLETAEQRVQPFNWSQGMERSYDLCLDGVFGFGFRPPIAEPAA
jgi:NAD(P)H-hydrate repair Nnr-like enzyme with NAD(P)H-hydrate epimerase domain